MIWEELKESLILTDVEADTSDDVMKQVGSKIIEGGYAKDSFVEALINREKDFPTGLDIDGFGVAIPHTDVSHVNSSATAIAILDKPVTFVQMGSDDDYVDAKVVFMLAVDDPKGHLEQLQRIITIIQDKNVLTELTTATEPKQIIEVIKEKENTL
ncbi:MAG: PTS sugar transporter subunit IIA [Clostridiales bacterium]|nr:PTS sugar transporter subunit IIA [Clostridiales bacterium]